MRFPEKVTWYGGPDRAWQRIVETYERPDGLVEIRRVILLNTAVETVVFRIETQAIAARLAACTTP